MGSLLKARDRLPARAARHGHATLPGVQPRFERRGLLRCLGMAGAMVASAALLPSQAWAAVRGRFRLNRKRVDEEEGAWRVLILVRLNAPPPSAALALRLDWRQHVDIEQDGDRQRRRALVPPRLITEQREADFSDPKGKVGTEARLEAVLGRERDFRAGDWSLEVRGPDGPLGARTALTLRGTNPT
jgi:hypothetical protein